MTFFRHFVLLGTLVLPGCQPSTVDTSGTKAHNGDPLPVAQPGEHASVVGQTGGDSRWDLIYMGGQPVGYQSLTLGPDDPENRLLTATATSVLSVQRFGQSTRETMQLTSQQTTDGGVVMVELRVQSGNSEIRTAGRRQADQLQFESFAGTGTGSKSWSVPLPSDCGGFFAVEWSLRRDPMIPGEERDLKAVVPVINLPAAVTLRAGARESVDVNGMSLDLTRIDQRTTLPDGNSIESVSWMDDTGEILKTELPALQQVSIRVDRETAMAVGENSDFDLGDFSVVRLSEPLAKAQQTRRVRYRISSGPAKLTRLFPNTSSQSVQVLPQGSLDVTVTAVRPGEGEPSLATSGPGPGDRQASAIVQSDDPAVLELVSQIQPAQDDPWSRAVATERFVYETLTEKDLSTAFATAAEVARSRQGDCTEHAVLTTALCRAQGLPARGLVGLIYVPSQQGFVFHMWNEVWIEDRWIPIDSTLGLGGIAAAHLVLARSRLSSEDAFSTLLPVMGVMGQLEIEVLSVEYEPETRPKSGG